MTEVGNVDLNKVLNPSTGLFYRNPTHVDEATRARTQSDIVAAVIGAGRETIHEIMNYGDPDVTEFPGFKKILQPVLDEEGNPVSVTLMKEEEVLGLCKSFLRSRPNIYGFRISFGDYSQKKLDNSKTRDLGARYQRFQTEIAESLAKILSDRSMRVVEVVYSIQSNKPGSFVAVADVYSTTEEEYNDFKRFSPIVERDYFPNT